MNYSNIINETSKERKGSSMEIQLRLEEKSDYRVVEELTRDAFWNHHVPGCDEHYLAHILRTSPAFVKELDFVALVNDQIVGNIMYSKAFIQGDDGKRYPVLSFGPISVLNNMQGMGIGSSLIQHTMKLAAKLGYQAIVIYGDPEYYHRFGFTGAENFNIGTAWDTYATPLLACELIPGALQNCPGKFYEDDIYHLDETASALFDQNFPPKEKCSGLPSQKRFSELVAMNRPR